MTKIQISAAVILSALLITNLAAAEYPVSKKAQALAQKYVIVDGHIDVPYRVFDNWVDVGESTQGGDFDFYRAKSGGLNAPFMSIYIPSSQDDSDESTATAHKLIDSVEALVGRHPDKFAIAYSANDVVEQKKRGLVSLPLGLENGSPVQGNLSTLEELYDRGIRYITLTHAKSNHISDSSYDENKQWGGLSEFGETMVAEMNRLGIMVDVSHVSDDAFYDAVKISKAPMIASHSSLRTFTPGFERNMSDDMITKLAENGGVIMINFGSTFITAKAQQWSKANSAQRAKTKQEFGEESEEYKNHSKNFLNQYPLPFATMEDVLDHIDYAVKLVGINHVGLGSDYDGVGDSLPDGLKSVADYPKLVQGMLDRGYKNKDIEKILGGNALRVWAQVEALAAEQ